VAARTCSKKTTATRALNNWWRAGVQMYTVSPEAGNRPGSKVGLLAASSARSGPVRTRRNSHRAWLPLP
jgi:hypothetical protein